MADAAAPKQLSIQDSGRAVDIEVHVPGRGTWRARFEGPDAREMARRWVAGIDRELGRREYWKKFDAQAQRDANKDAAPEVFGPKIAPRRSPDKPASQEQRAQHQDPAPAQSSAQAPAQAPEPTAPERAAASPEPDAGPAGPPQEAHANFDAEPEDVIVSDPKRVERYADAARRGLDPELYEQRYQMRRDHTVERELAKRYFSIIGISLPGIVAGEVAAAAGVGALAGSAISTSVDIAWNQALRAHAGMPSMTGREIGVQAAQGMGPQVVLSVVARALKMMPSFNGTKPKAPRTPSTAFYKKALDVIKSDANHPLKNLIDPETGNFFAKRHAADAPNVQMGHSVSHHSGAPERVFLEDADYNQMTNWTIETQGNVAVKACVEIGGVPVELGTAKRWEGMGLIPAGSVANATPSIGWVP